MEALLICCPMLSVLIWKSDVGPIHGSQAVDSFVLGASWFIQNESDISSGNYSTSDHQRIKENIE